MKTPNRPTIVALAIIGGGLALAVGMALSGGDEKRTSWTAAAEGFLAIATPCCTRASLWEELDAISPDGQRARPASVAEAARWIDDWPYRSREDHEGPQEAQLSVALQSSEVRCTGLPSGHEAPRYPEDEETLEAIRNRPECVYTKWKAWSGETADERPNERHTVWVDEAGLFHGRVDYWRPE